MHRPINEGMIRAFETSESHSHVSFFYSSPGELRLVLIPYLKNGTRQRGPVLVSLDARQVLPDALLAAGDNGAGDANDLRTVAENAWRHPGEAFDSASTLAAIREIVKNSRNGKGGSPTLVLDMTPVLEELDSTALLLFAEFLHSLTDLAGEMDFQFIGLYDLNRLPEEQIGAILPALPAILYQNHLCLNTWYNPAAASSDDHGISVPLRQIFQQLVDRTETVRRLHLAEKQLDVFFNTVVDGIVSIDEQGTILDVNTPMEKLFGYTRDEMIGQSVNLLMSESDRKRHPASIQNYLETGEAHIIGYGREVTGRHKDGSTFPMYLAVGETLLDGKHYFTGVIRNITEEKVQQMKQRERELLYLSVLEDQTDLIKRWKPDGTLTFVNDAYCRYFGLDRKDLLRHSFIPRVPKEDRPKIQKALETLTPENPVTEIEHRIVHPDGKIHWQQWIYRALFDDDGHIEEAQSVGRDITKHKEDEAEREMLIRELKAKNDELERFTYTVSHDLKSPLITIKGFMGYIRQSAAEGNTRQLNEDLERIEKAADKMEELLKDLLALSRVGRISHPFEDVDLNRLVEDVVQVLAGQMNNSGAKLTIHPDMPTVHADRQRLFDAFQNLIDNAVKFSRHKKQPKVTVGARDGENGKVIFVEDNGVGVDPKYADKMFNLFEKMSQDDEGSGVGLALVKRIVEIHNGEIWVESEGPGKGCRICFTLPGKPNMLSEAQR